MIQKNSAKEKAKELVDEFTVPQHLIAANNIEDARLCAHICINEILSNIQDAYNLLVPQECELGQKNLREDYEYWSEVKKEIEKL